VSSARAHSAHGRIERGMCEFECSYRSPNTHARNRGDTLSRVGGPAHQMICRVATGELRAV